MKRLRAPTAKPGELKMQWGKLPGDNPDMCFCWGDGCSKRDGHFLHYVLASARPTMNRDEHGNPMFDKSVLEQLDERGYDLTTLKFSIQKKPKPTPAQTAVMASASYPMDDMGQELRGEKGGE